MALNWKMRLTIARGVLASALAWRKIVNGTVASDGRPDNDDKLELLRYDCGFTDPNLRWDTDGSASHNAIDLLVEWARRGPPQRTVKLGSYWLACMALAALCGWLTAIAALATVLL